jgi:hypothetical protein
MVTVPATSSVPSTDAELERFRREWEKEVKQRRTGPPLGGFTQAKGKQVATGDEASEETADRDVPEKHKFSWRSTSPQRSMRERLAGLRLDEVEVEADDAASDVDEVGDGIDTSEEVSGPSASAPPRAVPAKAESPKSPSKPYKSFKASSPNKYTPLLPTASKLRSIAATKAADAVVLYTRAVEAEQTGRLNEALALYRRAFRLDGECKFEVRLMNRWRGPSLSTTCCPS